ncbi:MAG TPA: hypothetical protein VGL22_08140 [Terracidiphilus sp.]
MIIDHAEIVSPLLQKFQTFYEQFAQFSQDATELHCNLPVQDEPSRAAFNSLSRILAFSDQLSVLVSMMREDVRVVDELTGNPIEAKWADEIDECFYELLKASKGAAANVN